MDLVIDHSRQQPAAGGIDDLLVGAGIQAAADMADAAVLDAQVAFELPAFVDHPGIDDEGGGHQCFPEQEGEEQEDADGTGSCPPG